MLASWVSDIKFVLAEAVRLESMTGEELRNEGQWTIFHNIPSPGGQGFVIIGVAAGVRLENMVADFLVRQTEYAGRIAPHNVISEVKSRISQRFLKDGSEVNAASVNSILQTAVHAVGKMRADTVHFIPCHVVSRNEPGRFHVGPVEFINVNAFKSEIESDFRKYREKVSSANLEANKFNENITANELHEWSYRHAKFLTNGVEKYFSEFRWVAKVVISGCDFETSQWRAHQAVNAAIDAIRLFMKPGYADRMCAGGRRHTYPYHARLAKMGGELEISVTPGLEEGEAVDEGWWATLSEDEVFRMRMKGIGQAISTITSPQPAYPLIQRFLDALAWFGSASDDDAAGRLIKYTNAIERMVLGNERDGITEKVCERATAHAYSGSDRNFADKLAEANQIYTYRSKLVHGVISPSDAMVRQLWARASKMCQFVLIGGLDFFMYLGFDALGITNKQFRGAYEQLVKNAKAINRGEPAPAIRKFK